MTVTGTGDFPDRHASLSDGSTTIEFIFTDGQGNKSERAFKADPYPRTALKTTQGESKYSDLEPPYFAIAQDDFTGGRANLDFESDTSRYYDGSFVDTTKESGVVLGGRETYYNGWRPVDQAQPGSMTFQALYTGTRYIGVTFNASESYTTYQCQVWVKKVGSPGDLQVELWSDSASAPNAMLASKTLTAANVTTDVISVLVAFVWTGSPAITASTDYWVVIDGGASATSTNYWAIGCDASTAGVKSSDSSSWSATTYSPYYRINNAVGAELDGKFFEYKGALLYAQRTNVSGADSFILYNGDWGAADSNSGAKSTLVDATKSWTTDEWAGSVVKITAGPGSDEKQNWRTISSNTGTALTVSPDWEITHTTDTTYVILGSNKWTEELNIGDEMSDTVVAGEHTYQTFGTDSGSMLQHRWWNNGGTWTRTSTSEPFSATKLLGIRHPNDGNILYYARNEDELEGTMIGKANVPRVDDILYKNLGTLVDTTKPWDSVATTNITNTTYQGNTRVAVAAGFTTGVAAVRNLDATTDVTEATDVTFWIRSSVAQSASDLSLHLYESTDGLKEHSPVKVLKADYSYNRQPTKVYHLDEVGSSPTWTDLTETYDGISVTTDVVSIETDDRLLVGFSEPFDGMYVDVTVVNNVVSTMSAYYFDGINFVAVSSLSDGTITGTDPNEVSLGQDGTVTWAMPTEWVPSTHNSVEAYWMYFSWDASLLATMSIARIAIVMNDAATMDAVYDDLTNTYDGEPTTNNSFTLATSDYLYIGYSDKFNEITFDIGTASSQDGNLTADYFDGDSWTSETITDGTASSPPDYAFENDGDVTFGYAQNWVPCTVNGTEAYWIRLAVTTALTTPISINQIKLTNTAGSTLNIGALAANKWTRQTLAYVPEAHPEPDDTNINAIGLVVNTDNGACNIDIRDVRLTMDPIGKQDNASRLPSSDRVTGMEAYAGNVDDPVENPWVFTESKVYELQTQNDDQIVAVPLRELAALASSDNGRAHTVNGTYLYFNIGEKIERYFNRTLDDVGPDRDEGLPSARQGIPVSLASYPGRVFAAIDAGTSGTSSVLELKGTSWREVFRAPQAGRRIYACYVQSIPGTNVDRLWIAMEAELLWVPVSLNPYNDTDFTYQHEGYLTTSYIHANLIDVQKLWKSLKLFVENVDSATNIIADYQVDGDTSWTEIGTFDTVPVEEIDIASSYPQGRRIRYRLRFVTDDQTNSPRLKAMVTEGVAFVPVKYQYAWNFKIAQDVENIDLFGVYDDTLTSLQQYNQLVSWANAGQPLTLRHHSSLYDNKTVFLNPTSVSPLRVVDEGPEGAQEVHIASITCIEA